MTATTPTPGLAGEVRRQLIPEDLAEVLRVHLNTVYKWASDGTLPPPRRLGRRLYWSPEVIAEWMARREGSTDAA